MNEFKESGETTTTTTGTTKMLRYERQGAKTNNKKIIELPTFKVQTMENAFKEIAPTVENQKNIFGDLISEGDLCILFGRAGTGKSFLAYQIGSAIAEGRNVLDMLDIMAGRSTTKYHDLNNETHAQKVLYADFEATIEKTYRRYNPYTFSPNFLIAIPDRLTVVDNLLFIDSIEAEIIKTGAKVLIIDNISAISQDNEKSNQAAKLMNKIKDLQRRNKLTILIMAHTPKIVQGQAIIWTNMAGSSNLYNLAESILAIGTTTIDNDIRYIIQLKARYVDILYHKDNVIAIKFRTTTDGNKGFSFLNYECEEELIKTVEKSRRDAQKKDILIDINQFGMKPSDIAEELYPKYYPDKEITLITYKDSIKKAVQRLKKAGLINNEEEVFNPGNKEIPTR